MSNIEEAKARYLAMMSDDEAAVELAKQTLTSTGANTASPTIPETTVKLSLQATEKKPAISMQFGLKKGYLEDSEAFVAQYGESFKVWCGIDMNFELLSKEPLLTLERDNYFYRVSSMVNKKSDNSDVVRIGNRIGFDILPITNKEGQTLVKGLGLHLYGKRFLRFFGSLLASIGKATLLADGTSYMLTADAFEEINNGVEVLKLGFTEKVKSDEPISEDAKLNHPDLVTYFIAQQQLQNLNDMLMQYGAEFRTFGAVIGRELVPEDKHKQRNYVKDIAHSETAEGADLLSRAVA